MVHDKIQILLKELTSLKDKLGDLKKDMRKEEKVEREDYLELKKAYKDLRAQIKEIEEDHEDELKSDDYYNKMREMRLNLEEDVALKKQELFTLIGQLPVKPVQIKMDTESGVVNINIQPEMRVYVNGKEEKVK